MIDDFLKPEIADAMFENFPTSQEMRKSYKNLNEQKSEGSGFNEYHPAFKTLKDELRTEKFLEVFSKLTGIDNLILPDDHRGSGVHPRF